MFLVLSGDRAAGSLRDLIDAELAEVREVLEGLLKSKGAYLFHEDECPWQYGPDDCACRVQRARALYDKLRTDKE